MPRISLKTLKEAAKGTDYSVTRTAYGEYRVAPIRPADRQWAEDRAYYTDDAADALATLRAMVAEGLFAVIERRATTVLQ